MRNPNGYGSVIDLGKGRRNRYAVRITDKMASAQMQPDGTFKQKYKYIGYYNNIKDARLALAEYNTKGAPTNYIGITFAEIWQKIAEKIPPNTSRSRSYNAAFQKCAPLHKAKMTDIRLQDLEQIMQTYSDQSKSAVNNIKVVMNFVFEWAVKNDVIQKNYAQYVDASEHKEVTGHTPFTSAEIASLWENPDKNRIALMYIYTGCRPAELLELTWDNVHLSENYFEITKSKTKAGIRSVPIADKIKPFFDYCSQHKTNDKVLNITYERLKAMYRKLSPAHKPHDTRVTFTTLMQAAGISEVITQKIVGHSSGIITRDVYTKFEIQTLIEAVNKI